VKTQASGSAAGSWLAGAALLAALLLPAASAPAADRLPIFDCHAHYSRDAWAVYPPAAVRAKLEAAGVLRALVSSSPDDGSLMLVQADPRRFVPVLRPYREGVTLSNWTTDAATPDYLRGRLARGGYVGLGEFHLNAAEDARTPVVRAVARLAVEHGLLLHVHSGAEPVRALFEIEPSVRILWGHAGMVSPPAEVREMMRRHTQLWAELSFRENDVARGGRLDPEWQALLAEFPERFMVGSDTYRPFRWEEYEAIIAAHRRYLALLPPKLARAVAYGNAVRLFGAGAAQSPQE
jgi:Amidohydrolase